jgi:hypothetical protein
VIRGISFIVLHTCGAAKRGVAIHQPVGVVRAFHKLPKAKYDAKKKLVPGTGGRGFFDLGYHWYVEENGSGHQGRIESRRGAHVEGFNHHTLGLCVSGHGDIESWNPEQMAEVLRKCEEWCRTYKLEAWRVIGHNETDDHGGPPVFKTCPGNLICLPTIREKLAERLTRAA